MTASPAPSYFTGVITNDDAKAAQNAMLAVMAEALGGSPVATYTISGGGITPAVAVFDVDTEGGDPTDDLTHIVPTNHPIGRVIVLSSQDAGRVVTVKHLSGISGQIELCDGQDLVLTSSHTYLTLVRMNATSWREIGRYYGNAPGSARTKLGLGTAALRNIGTGGVTEVPDLQLADARYAQLAAGNAFGVQQSIIQGSEIATSLHAQATHATFAGNVMAAVVNRNGATALNFLVCIALYGTGSDNVKFALRGDGNAFADGSWAGGGAGHAECLEWEDGNPGADDRVGITVVPTGSGSLIRPARQGEEPIGVVTATAAFISGAAPLGWQGKFERDAFGRPRLDGKGAPVLSKAYDAAKEFGDRRRRAEAMLENEDVRPQVVLDSLYRPRLERPEWAAIGLNGAEFVRRGQPVGSRWRKLADGDPERWLII
jgi:hypothetical protein